jgi:hypothetical protein
MWTSNSCLIQMDYSSQYWLTYGHHQSPDKNYVSPTNVDAGAVALHSHSD